MPIFYLINQHKLKAHKYLSQIFICQIQTLTHIDTHRLGNNDSILLANWGFIIFRTKQNKKHNYVRIKLILMK